LRYITTMTVSICIPKAPADSLNKSLIFNTFKELQLGMIKNITIHRNGCIFIAFTRWFESERNNDIQKKLLNGENIYVVYDNKWGWFWKCRLLENTYSKTI
jgi:hypothetical protein